jgi:hypothetical protein
MLPTIARRTGSVSTAVVRNLNCRLAEGTRSGHMSVQQAFRERGVDCPRLVVHVRGSPVAKLHYEADGDVSPEAFVAALTDFSERRPELWPNLSASLYRVHTTGPTWAEVTEGTDVLGGVWARERYDWSTPGTVTLRLLEAPAFVPGTTITYRVTARNGGCHVAVDFQRIARTAKGRLVGAILQVTGARRFRADLRETLARLAARQRAAAAPGPG